VTVSDRQAPPESAPYGTQMARQPVSVNLAGVAPLAYGLRPVLAGYLAGA